MRMERGLSPVTDETSTAASDPAAIDAEARRLVAAHGLAAREILSRLIWNARAGQDIAELRRLAEIDRALLVLGPEECRAQRRDPIC